MKRPLHHRFERAAPASASTAARRPQAAHLPISSICRLRASSYKRLQDLFRRPSEGTCMHRSQSALLLMVNESTARPYAETDNPAAQDRRPPFGRRSMVRMSHSSRTQRAARPFRSPPATGALLRPSSCDGLQRLLLVCCTRPIVARLDLLQPRILCPDDRRRMQAQIRVPAVLAALQHEACG